MCFYEVNTGRGVNNDCLVEVNEKLSKLLVEYFEQSSPKMLQENKTHLNVGDMVICKPVLGLSMDPKPYQVIIWNPHDIDTDEFSDMCKIASINWESRSW